MQKSRNSPFWTAGAALFTSAALLSAQSNEPTVLDAFIAEETAAEASDSLLPTDRTVSSAFFDDMSILDIPRSVLVLSPEAMKQFQINDFSDLDKIGAGTDRYNFYGIAGTPVIRGWEGGAYFNGMLRATQRNEMPTSFGSLEAMNVVKGPAPAHYIATQIGGYVDMLPKSPYFDQFRGSIEFQIGTHDSYRTQIDVGAPILLGETPAAYRISVTGQLSDSYYDAVSNDYFSVYGALKAKLSDRTSLFFGGEYYNFKSNENAGWNRPSQNLINNSQYVIGEPLSLVRPGNGGVADRNIIDSVVFNFSSLTNGNLQDFRALVVPTAVVDAAVLAGTITAAQRSFMKDMSDATVRANTYAGLPADIVQTTSGYLYTADYFVNGGRVFTDEIKGSTVLADPNDFADSNDLMFFFDFLHDASSNFKIENKVFLEFMETDKLSSYGYAIKSKQKVLDDRVTGTYTSDGGGFFGYTLAGGAQLRYTQAQQLQDFWTEPFARRDITTGSISPNSVILAGGQVDPLNGNNYWGGGFGSPGPAGHASLSQLAQIGLFSFSKFDFGNMFSVIASVRHENADYSASVPDGPTDIAPRNTSGSTSYTNYSVNPVFKVTPELSLYAAYQQATTLIPLQGGVVLSEVNFGEGELREVGVKYSFLSGRGVASAALYEWEQSAYSDRDAATEQYESKGFELEVSWAVTETITVLAAYSERETRRLTPLGFRTMPWGLVDPTGANNDEIGLALESGALLNQFSDAFGGFTPQGATPSNNPKRIVPGAPESSAKVFAVVDLPAGFQVSGGAVYRSSFWHNYDRTIKLDSSIVASANVGWSNDTWSVFLSVENLFGEDYFLGADPGFGANTLITKAPGTEGSLSVKYNF